jgi:hypothetical protein
MSRSRQKWHCPHCSQTSSRHWNLKTHIRRKHHGTGKPIGEDGRHSIATSNADLQFIPDIIMNFKNNNNNYNMNRQVHPNTFSGSLYLRNEEQTPKKRDASDEWLEFWRPIVQKMKEILEIKKFISELSSYSSSLQQPNIITGLGQTPIIDTIIPPVTITPLQPTPLASAPSPQQQEQKKENTNPGTDLITNLFITSTLAAEEIHRRSRGGGEGEEGFITIPQEPSLSPPVNIITSDDNNNNSKKRGEANLSTKNTKKEEDQLEEDSHDIEGHPLSRNKLLIDNKNDGVGVDHVHLDYDDGGKWVRHKDKFGNVIDVCKGITDPLMEVKEYYYQIKKKAGEKIGTKRKEISIRWIREGRRMKDVIKKVTDNWILYD